MAQYPPPSDGGVGYERDEGGHQWCAEFLSVLDGWWIEGHLEDVTGWSIGDVVDGDPDVKRDIDDRHAAELCHKLETKIIPTFYHERDRFLRIMRYAIALNGGFFNSQRMVLQYLHKAYRLTGEYVRRR